MYNVTLEIIIKKLTQSYLKPQILLYFDGL